MSCSEFSVKRLLVKAPQNAVQPKVGVRAEAGVVAGARVYQGIVCVHYANGV